MKFRQAKYQEPVIFELGSRERTALDVSAACDLLGDVCDHIPEKLISSREPEIPGLTEVEVARHYTRLSQMNWGVDSGIYPLGSCTMKYNPKINEKWAGYDKFTLTHPEQPDDMVQGNLAIIYELEKMLQVIGGVDAITLQPEAGAHGEFTGLLIARAYHEEKGEIRDEIILPDTAHGTNPASAAMAGFKVIEIPSRDDGCVDIDALKSALSKKTCAFMLTNPNTLGIFEKDAVEIAKTVHKSGALLYYDGANLNAIMGKTTPGFMGFDIVHFNLHKTFATPHGGGGPGAGPIGVKKHLEKFLPVPRVKAVKENGKIVRYYLDKENEISIGKVAGELGNFGVLIKAYMYIRMMGAEGLETVSEYAVLNSNYLRCKLEKLYPLPFPGLRKHEFVLKGDNMKEKGVKTTDIAKALLDQGLHAPTIYFPQIFHEAIMVEPTETESLEELQRFYGVMKDIIDMPGEELRAAPVNTTVGRLDETFAVKNMIFTYKDLKQYRMKQSE